MFVLKKKAIDFLNQYFKLPAKGNEQDWDVELADSNRIKEFLNGYRGDFTGDVKLALMALILASYEDFLHENKENSNIENEIKEIFDDDILLFADLLKYWALQDEEKREGLFNITNFVRKFL
jgi:hypothetical protein